MCNSVVIFVLCFYFFCGKDDYKQNQRAAVFMFFTALVVVAFVAAAVAAVAAVVAVVAPAVTIATIAAVVHHFNDFVLDSSFNC